MKKSADGNLPQSFFREAFLDTPYGLVILDSEGRCLEANTAAAQLLGIRRERVAGKNIWKMLAPPDRSLNIGEDSEYELRFRRSDGDAIHLGVRFQRGFHGRNHLLVLRDITARKITEDELRRQAQMLDFANDTIMIRDMNDIITYWNQGAERFYGWNKSEALGKHVHSFLKTQFPEPIEKVLRKCLRLGHWEGVLVHLKKDGTAVQVSSRWTLERDESGTPMAFMEINNDITERERAKEQLQRAHDELEIRVDERTEELSIANARLKALSSKLMSAQEEERRRISRDLHDDLGQILTSMNLSLQRAKQSKDASHVARLIERVIVANEEARHRLRELSSRLRPRVLDEVGLKEAVQTYISEFESRTGIASMLRFRGFNKELSAEAATCVYRVLQEALTNISKYAQAKSVRVHLSAEKGKVLLRILDDGIGFDPNSIMMDRTLGISGMKERSEMMGGNFLLKSCPGKGTEVFVSFPIETFQTAVSR